MTFEYVIKMKMRIEYVPKNSTNGGEYVCFLESQFNGV